MAVNLGWGVGPAIGGLMAQSSYALMFAATALMCALCLALLRLGLRYEPAARGGEPFTPLGVAAAARDRRYLEFCLYTLAIAGVMMQLVACLSVHAVNVLGVSEKEVGRLFALNGLLVLVIQLGVTRALSRVKLSLCAALGCLLYAAGYGAVGFARGFSHLTAAVAVVTVGEAVLSPSVHSLAANMAPARERGRYVGFHGLSFQLGCALGPLLGGLSLQRFAARPAVPWLLVAGVGTAAAAGFARFSRRLTTFEEGLA